MIVQHSEAEQRRVEDSRVPAEGALASGSKALAAALQRSFFTNRKDAMSQAKETGAPAERIQLRGERPPGVVGEMQPGRLLARLREARKEHTLEDDERSWRELSRILREDPV